MKPMLPSTANRVQDEQERRSWALVMRCEAQRDLIFARARQHFEPASNQRKRPARPPNRNFETLHVLRPPRLGRGFERDLLEELEGWFRNSSTCTRRPSPPRSSATSGFAVKHNEL